MSVLIADPSTVLADRRAMRIEHRNDEPRADTEFDDHMRDTERAEPAEAEDRTVKRKKSPATTEDPSHQDNLAISSPIPMVMPTKSLADISLDQAASTRSTLATDAPSEQLASGTAATPPLRTSDTAAAETASPVGTQGQVTTPQPTLTAVPAAPTADTASVQAQASLSTIAATNLAQAQSTPTPITQDEVITTQAVLAADAPQSGTFNTPDALDAADAYAEAEGDNTPPPPSPATGSSTHHGAATANQHRADAAGQHPQTPQGDTPSPSTGAPAPSVTSDQAALATKGGASESTPRDAANPTPAAPVDLRAQTQAAVATTRADTGAQLRAETLAQLAVRIAKRFDGQNSTFQLRLDPPELGHVAVKLTIGADKRVNAKLSAEKPEALAALQDRSSELGHMLSELGLNLEDAGLSFDLQTPGQNAFADRDDPQAFRRAHVAVDLDPNDLPDDLNTSSDITTVQGFAIARNRPRELLA